MPDSPDELLRQRELVRQHLAWLDAQIARTQGEPADRTVPPPLAPAAAPLPARLAADAEAILAQYRVPERDLKLKTKAGCFLYFAAGLLLLGFALGWLYLRTLRR